MTGEGRMWQTSVPPRTHLLEHQAQRHTEVDLRRADTCRHQDLEHHHGTELLRQGETEGLVADRTSNVRELLTWLDEKNSWKSLHPAAVPLLTVLPSTTAAVPGTWDRKPALRSRGGPRYQHIDAMIGGIAMLRVRSRRRKTMSSSTPSLFAEQRGAMVCLALDLRFALLVLLLCCIDRAGVRGAWSASQPARLFRVGAWPARGSAIACCRGVFAGGQTRSLLALEGRHSSSSGYDDVEGGGGGGGGAGLGLAGSRRCGGSWGVGGGGGAVERGGVWMKANKKNKRKREERQGSEKGTI